MSLLFLKLLLQHILLMIVCEIHRRRKHNKNKADMFNDSHSNSRKNRKNYDQVVCNDDQEKNSASSTLFDNDGAQLISLIHDTLRQNQK